MALSAVLLPAPFGPMSPRMRPSSTRKLTPSSAMVLPKALRSPRASMTCHDFGSSSLSLSLAFDGLPLAASSSSSGVQAEPLNGGVDPRPLFRKKLLPFALQQQIARARIDEHATTSLALDQLLVDQLLIALQHRKRIDPIFRRDIAHRGQRIALFEHAVEDHRDHAIAKLAVNRLTVVPLTVHGVFQVRLNSFYFLGLVKIIHEHIPPRYGDDRQEYPQELRGDLFRG